MNESGAREAIIEPDLPIIDPHHHLWDLRPLMPMFPEPRHHFIAGLVDNAYYTFDELQAHLTSGHNIIGTVFMECGAFYNGALGEALKPVGEVEFVNGVAAQSASGLYGAGRACAGPAASSAMSYSSSISAIDRMRALARRWSSATFAAILNR